MSSCSPLRGGDQDGLEVNAIGTAPHAEDGYAYDAFISYRRSDGSQAARWLWRWLRRYTVPSGLALGPSARLRVYLDRAFESASEDFWVRSIRPSLRGSRFLIVVLTPDVLLPLPDGSDNWVVREISEFLSHAPPDRVIAVRAKGDFPGALPGPLAAVSPNADVVDLRRLGRRRALAMLWPALIRDPCVKLLAPLFGIVGDGVLALRRLEARRGRWLALRNLLLLVLLTLTAGASGWWRLQHPAVRHIAGIVPVGYCAAEDAVDKAGSVVQLFQNGWLVYHLAGDAFYVIRDPASGTLEWWRTPAMSRRGAVECDQLPGHELLDRGFRRIMCEHANRDLFRGAIGRALSCEERVLLQFQPWSRGLLISGLPGSVIGLRTRGCETQRSGELASLVTVFLAGAGGAATSGVGRSVSISSSGQARAWCTPIWFTPDWFVYGGIKSMNWRGQPYQGCADRRLIRGQDFYTRPRLACALE